MACPKCGCKEVYQHNSAWDPSEQDDEREQSCAACGAVFDIDDSADEDDEDRYSVIEQADAAIRARHPREPHYLTPTQASLLDIAGVLSTEDKKK